MLNNSKKESSFLDKVKWLSICPFCNTKFSIDQARIISEKKDSFLLHAYCQKCKCSVLASLIANPMGISSIGLVTDLTYEDVLRFKKASEINSDDIICAYQDLSKTKYKFKN
ncbi:MAG: hypothetical protein WC663_01725 [Patescibacteria group bacterium]|jgi:hypothetical protein